MAPSPRFENLPPDRQQEILDAATDEFAAGGYEGTSYNRVLEHAGISKGAAYYYFHDKADLFRTVLSRAADRIVQAVGGPGPIDSAEAFWREVDRMNRRAFGFFAQHPTMAGLGKSLLKISPGTLRSSPVGSLYAAFQAFIGRLLKKGQAVGAVRDDLPVPLLVELVSAMGESLDRWTMARWSELGHDPDALAALYLDLFRRVLAPGRAQKVPKRGGR